jgi:hypothetical protein
VAGAVAGGIAGTVPHIEATRTENGTSGMSGRSSSNGDASKPAASNAVSSKPAASNAASSKLAASNAVSSRPVASNAGASAGCSPAGSKAQSSCISAVESTGSLYAVTGPGLLFGHDRRRRWALSLNSVRGQPNPW